MTNSKIKADLTFNDNRVTPLKGEYRPLFEFEENIKSSGLIYINPGETLALNATYKNRLVEFYYSENIFSYLKVGVKFKIYEGSHYIGNGIIKEVIT